MFVIPQPSLMIRESVEVQPIKNEFNVCVIPPPNSDPIEEVTGQLQGPPNSTSVHGEQCTPVVSDENIEKFNVANANMLGFIYLASSNVGSDRSKTNIKGQNIAEGLRLCLKFAQETYIAMSTALQTQISQMSSQNVGGGADTLGIEMIRLQALSQSSR